jgi:hypothetical protein
MDHDDGRGGEQPPQPAAIDVADRWNFYLSKRQEIEAIIRETLDLPPAVDVSGLAQHFAMAALPPPAADPDPPRPAGRATEPKIRRELLRIERAARGAVRPKPRKDAADLLQLAINDAPAEVKGVLPGAVVLAALLHNAEEPTPPPLREAMGRLAETAGAIAATIPPAPHPGGRRPAKIDETALALLLAQGFTSLTGKPATVNNRDLDEYATSGPSPFMLLTERVFLAAGLAGSPRKAAERAVGHMKATRSLRHRDENEQTDMRQS